MNIYENDRYKKLFIIPAIMLIILLFFATRITYGMDFRGGTRITTPLEQDLDVAELEFEINERFNLLDLDIRKTEGIERSLMVSYVGDEDILQIEQAFEEGSYRETIEMSKEIIDPIEDIDFESEEEEAREYLSVARETSRRELISYLSERTGTEEGDFSVDTIGVAMGAQFLDQARNAILVAILFIAILVFYFFRELLVSLAVFQSPVYDIVFGLGIMGLLQIPLNLATIAALLMILGYSIDSDIMLTMKVLNRKDGTPEERALGALKTGLTMEITTISALTALLIVSNLVQIEILASISIILILGIIGDSLTTWFINAPIMIRTAKKREK